MESTRAPGQNVIAAFYARRTVLDFNSIWESARDWSHQPTDPVTIADVKTQINVATTRFSHKILPW